MTDQSKSSSTARRVTSMERLLSRSPFATVSMVARIKGNVSEDALKSAVSKIQARHFSLRVRIVEDEEHELWFTPEGVDAIAVEVMPRKSDDHWISVRREAVKMPFDFEARPAIRFILLQSPEMSDLLILCHHVICDGMSLAYLARDMMEQLGDPGTPVEVLADPKPIGHDNLPQDVSLSGLIKTVIGRINDKWNEDPAYFDHSDYVDLNEAYWQNFSHQLISIELTEDETSTLIQRCRDESVTVNSAITAAFAGAQVAVQGRQPFHERLAIGASLRDRVTQSPGEGMGFYAGAATFKFKFNPKKGFWDNARKLHTALGRLYTNKSLFAEILPWLELESPIMEAITFKRLSGLVAKGKPSFEKMSAYSMSEDVVMALLKRDKMESLDNVTFGTAVTNLTRMDFPRQYGELELDRLILEPGGAFPLVTVPVVVAAVTCSGKLSMVMSYAEEALDPGVAKAIKEMALEFLSA